MVKKLRKEHRIITYLNQTNDQLSTRYVLVFSSIILRVSPINVIDANKYAYFPLLPCNNFYLIHFFSRLKKRSPYATIIIILSLRINKIIIIIIIIIIILILLLLFYAAFYLYSILSSILPDQSSNQISTQTYHQNLFLPFSHFHLL